MVWLRGKLLQNYGNWLFEKSRWFTGGWTLQELLAPTLGRPFLLKWSSSRRQGPFLEEQTSRDNWDTRFWLFKEALCLDSTSVSDYDGPNLGRRNAKRTTHTPRSLTDCEFDQEVEYVLEQYVEPDEVVEPPHGPSSPDRDEQFRHLWDVVQRTAVRPGRFESLRDTY
jgi:hypothetical protein